MMVEDVENGESSKAVATKYQVSPILVAAACARLRRPSPRQRDSTAKVTKREVQTAEARQRLARIQEARAQGASLAEIGRRENLSAERVRQVLAAVGRHESAAEAETIALGAIDAVLAHAPLGDARLVSAADELMEKQRPDGADGEETLSRRERG
jgi:hypothetical protein